jgi:hypothetical protein
MRPARPPLTDLVPPTCGAAALKPRTATADEILVDRHARTSDAPRGGRA